MSASEFAFLALGLVLGVAAGAALLEVIRARPPARPVVRVTMAPDAIPRRPPATLAFNAGSTPSAPASGGPADRRETARPAPSRVERPLPANLVTVGAAPVGAAAIAAPLVGIAIHREPDPTLAALLRFAAPGPEEERSTVAVGTAVLDRPRADGSAEPNEPDIEQVLARQPTDPGGPADGSGTAAATAVTDAGPCGELRRVADERCTLAGRAREQATVAHEALRAAQREYDDHATRADRAAADTDPRAIRSAKEAAQVAFRAARAAATGREQIEAAARDWLTEINRINQTARDAASRQEKERSAAIALVAEIERLTVESDAARIAAESAEAACVAARDALATCDEEAADPVAALPAVDSAGGDGTGGTWERDEEAAIAIATGAAEPAILRLLRGDRATLAAVVAALARDDAEERRRWQRSLAALTEAIVARSIEASTLDFPADHGFWAPFTRDQARDIVGALSSLGYRFDGFGGWVDERVPGQRDLSLAIGYAGLDPMRIRHWPTEAETTELFRDVRVAADEYLASTAPGLTLGELVAMLGVRADGLTDLWNEWGRVRPLLLAAAP